LGVGGKVIRKGNASSAKKIQKSITVAQKKKGVRGKLRRRGDKSHGGADTWGGRTPQFGGLNCGKKEPEAEKKENETKGSASVDYALEGGKKAGGMKAKK